MSELTKVLLKERRGRDVQDHIKEEIADVEICLELLYDLKESGIRERYRSFS